MCPVKQTMMQPLRHSASDSASLVLRMISKHQGESLPHRHMQRIIPCATRSNPGLAAELCNDSMMAMPALSANAVQKWLRLTWHGVPTLQRHLR